MSTNLESQRAAMKGQQNLGRFKPPEKKSKPLSASVVEKLKGAFEAFDTEKNGVISVENIMAAMQREGTRVTRAQATRALGEVDSNGDGLIDVEEFTSNE